MNLKEINWNKKTYQEFINYLISIKNHKYQEFNTKIINTKYPMLGIKVPILKNIAKEISQGNYQAFLKNSSTNYYELVMLTGLVIGTIKDLNELNIYFLDYISLIDNWALCDTFCASLKIVNKHKEYFQKIINNLINTKQEYYVRVGLVLLLNYYVSEEYLSYIFNILDTINSDLYYINMAKAWLLCECFIKFESTTLVYLEHHNLNQFTINKSISKIKDSKRVSKEMKEYINKFKK